MVLIHVRRVRHITLACNDSLDNIQEYALIWSLKIPALVGGDGAMLLRAR